MANALVLNEPERPLIEVTALDLTVRADKDLLIAVTGAECDVFVDGFSTPRWRPIVIYGGSVVRISRIRKGLRCYLGVNGRIEAPTLLGSVSPSTSLEFGWQLRAGDVVPIESRFTSFDHPYLRHPVFRPAVPPRVYADPFVVEVVAGPDVAQFDAALDVLQSNDYEVGNQSNEIGLQLQGVVPARQITSEILSRGVAIGAIEVTPSGDLLALLRGRLLTAGYPVVAVATTCAQAFLGQAQPGDRIRFRLVTVDEAIRSARAERQQIDNVAEAMQRISADVPLWDAPGNVPS